MSFTVKHDVNEIKSSVCTPWNASREILTRHKKLLINLCFSCLVNVYINIQGAGNMNFCNTFNFRLCWKQNVETVKSVITDVKWKYRVKLWNKIWIAAKTMALEYLLIFYFLLIFCFAAQNIITQDSIALRHYWWCKSISCSSGYSFSRK